MTANKIFIFGLLGMLFLSSLSFAETTCEAKDCKITITIKIAFAFEQGVQNQDQFMQDVKDQIEGVWNNGNPTFGDCDCPVSFKVETTKITDPAQINCNPGPPGYHCIMVTDYNNNPPRNQTSWTGAAFYAGYMYGIATGNGGNSQRGWWSNQMSADVPGSTTGEEYLDYAHEAGHMMGLEDGDGGLMDTTSGANARVTQAHIDEVVNEICGVNACPDRCCCGNGNIDRDKGEQCDPFAGGCPSDEYCCPGCCQCYGKVCFPEWGEYLSQADCQASCGPNAKCYYNYQTGCWDCVEHAIVVEVQYDDSKVQNLPGGIHETRNTEIDNIRNIYEHGILAVPTLGGFFANERANIIIEGGNNYHALTDQGELYEVGGGLMPDPTVDIITDTGTLDEINAGELHPVNAYLDGTLKVEGVGFVEGIKFWFLKVLADTVIDGDSYGPGMEGLTQQVDPASDIGTVKEPVEEEPDREIDEIKEPVPASGPQYPESIPDQTFYREVEEYSEIYVDGTEVYNG